MRRFDLPDNASQAMRACPMTGEGWGDERESTGAQSQANFLLQPTRLAQVSGIDMR